MNNPADTFRQEAADLLESLEDNLLELEAEPSDRARIDTVFRALHTIKGSGEMFGFSALARFVHHLESAYENVRSGTLLVSTDLIEVSLSARDHIAALLEAGTDEAAGEALTATQTHLDLMARLEQFNVADGAPVHEDADAEAVAGDGPHKFAIYFKPEPSALRNGMRPDLVGTDLEELGTYTSHVIFDHVPMLDELDAGASYLAWNFELETEEAADRIEQIFLFFDDGDIEITDITPKPEPTAQTDGGAQGGGSDKAAAQDAGPARAAPKTETVRVQAHRLDDLMDQLGELVIAQAKLNRISDRIGDTELAAAAEEIERLVTGMRDATLSIRMLPIGGVFGKFRRVVRDLATELGKQVALVTEGGETELDKNIIDRLSDPLVHIIRNSVDHGVEDTATRVENGKSKESTLRMSARQTGGEVHISVHDDGGGLNTAKIREKALERGLIDADADMSDDMIHQLIFAPGFSTADQISSVSGRGVGMDAVRTFIEDLRGGVDVKSTKGVGTSVTLKLPLTLAIIDGLLVRVSDGEFVIPLASVEECVELSATELRGDRNRAIINIRNELVPFLNLGEVFAFDADEPRNRMVIVNADGRRVGLLVDDVVGQHQTVIKSLSLYHRNVPGLAGCTILGDGSVALIIDPAALVKIFGSRPREAA